MLLIILLVLSDKTKNEELVQSKVIKFSNEKAALEAKIEKIINETADEQKNFKDGN